MADHNRKIFFQASNTNTSTVQKLIWILAILVVIIQACAGYIINENGKLVPFRLYKKGGSRLHPRNCRGGFHKRQSDEPTANVRPRDRFEFKLHKRKQKTTVDNHGNNYDGPYNTDKNVFYSPTLNDKFRKGLEQSPERFDHDTFDTDRVRNDIFDMFEPSKSDFMKEDIDDIEITQTDLETLKDIQEANLLLGDLSRGIGEVAEPPPLDANTRIKAEVEEYPAYEIFENYDSNFSEEEDNHSDDSSLFSPVDIFELRRRK